MPGSGNYKTSYSADKPFMVDTFFKRFWIGVLFACLCVFPFVTSSYVLHLTNLVSNILENAVEACLEDTSEKSHTISLSVSQNKDYIIFDVQDNGLGMDEATRKNMFNIFFSSKGKKGTGLGLYISNKIIQQHGGSIEVKSDPGIGSQFSIKMPKILPEFIKAPQTN